MSDPLGKVKALAADMRRWARDFEEKGDNARAQINSTRAENIELVAHELEAARKRLRAIPTEYGDLSDLPSEVLAQLNLSKVDELEQQLRDIVAAANGREVGLDQIIIELYRRHKVVQERRFVMNKLYRMAQKGLVESVEGRKGVYYLPQQQGHSQRPSFDDDLDDDVPF